MLLRNLAGFRGYQFPFGGWFELVLWFHADRWPSGFQAQALHFDRSFDCEKSSPSPEIITVIWPKLSRGIPHFYHLEPEVMESTFKPYLPPLLQPYSFA